MSPRLYKTDGSLPKPTGAVCWPHTPLTFEANDPDPRHDGESAAAVKPPKLVM